ncbi:MAG: hypothetical protein AAF488_16115, partial [Planctomycetota bacterium]
MSSSASTPPADNPFRAPEPPRFVKPWDPGNILKYTITGGLLVGAILFRFNERRLDSGRTGHLLVWIAVIYTLVTVSTLSELVAYLESDRAASIEREREHRRDQVRQAGQLQRMEELLRESNERMRQAGREVEDFDDTPTAAAAHEELPPLDVDAFIAKKRLQEAPGVLFVWSLFVIGGAVIARVFTRHQVSLFRWAEVEGARTAKLGRPALKLVVGSWL